MKKLKLTMIFFLLLTLNCFAQEDGNYQVYSPIIKNGVSAGSVLAVVLSWERNKSILLAIVHGIFSWLYVIYFALTRKPSETKDWSSFEVNKLANEMPTMCIIHCYLILK